MNIKAFHEAAIDHIVQATNTADQGNKEETERHIHEASQAAQHHYKILKFQGRHKEAVDYLNGIQGHQERINALLARRLKGDHKAGPEQNIQTQTINNPVAKADAKKCSCKGEKCNCAYMNKSEEDPVAKIDQTWSLKPKQDPRFHYKKIHELHPDDQLEAQNKYGKHVKENLGRFLYPVDKQTGRLAHAAVKPFEGHSMPKAQSSAYGVKQLKPEHTKGASVRINAPNTALHGKLGIMTGTHPDLPGKVGVQVGPSQAHIHYVEPHQVHLSSPKTKVEKALISLNNIRKAFMK